MDEPPKKEWYNLENMEDFKPQIWNGVPIPYDSKIEDLQKMLHSPGPKAWAAIRALSSKPEPEALTILVELTKSPDWTFRRSAVEALGKSPCGPLASEVIVSLINDPVSYVGRTAMTAAANLNLTSAHKAILSLIKAPDQATRFAALSALDTLWVPTDYDEVVDSNLNDKSHEVRKQAARLIRNHIHSGNWQHWATIWSLDPSHEHRVWACQLIGEFGTQTDLPSLWILINDRDGHVRKAARMATQRIEGVE